MSIPLNEYDIMRGILGDISDAETSCLGRQRSENLGGTPRRLHCNWPGIFFLYALLFLPNDVG
ncbi:MAG: hypothetical protein ACI8Z1_003687 [Candidatus Azotimanducaceae bacterium]|jgi:hypothetical protein